MAIPLTILISYLSIVSIAFVSCLYMYLGQRRKLFIAKRKPYLVVICSSILFLSVTWESAHMILTVLNVVSDESNVDKLFEVINILQCINMAMLILRSIYLNAIYHYSSSNKNKSLQLYKIKSF